MNMSRCECHRIVCLRWSLTAGLVCAVVAGTPVSLLADQAAVLQQLAAARARFDTQAKWSERRGELRKEFLRGAGLWPLPARPPVEAIRHSRRDYKDYSVENVALETLPGFYCTGNLYRPKGRKDLGPAILCPHGHFRPLGRFRENHQIRCAQLARLGATVFSYSMVGWQDSRQTTHDDPLVLALQTWNSLRAVDFVCGLPRVDRGRIGITGASGGGTQTVFLTLIDDRIKASAPLVIVYPWAAPQGCLCEGGLPVMQAAATNAIELAAAAAPRPQLLISVGNDPTQNFPRVGFPFMRHMYAVAGAAERVQNVHLADEGHDFGPTKRARVYEFFVKHLGLRPDRFSAAAARERRRPGVPWYVEDLSRITLESPAQMEVFNKQHTRPQHAVQQADGVRRAFEDHLAQLRADQAIQDSGQPKPLEYTFQPAGPADEELVFTPPGFSRVGAARVAAGPRVGRLEFRVLDEHGKLSPCRINVVGPQGHFYEPRDHPLKPFSLTGVWPGSGWGNRPGKAPIRYLGRFFYSTGSGAVDVPSGTVRIEVWKGFEYRPTQATVEVRSGQTRKLELKLAKPADVTELGYWSGDPHIHIPRHDVRDEQRALQLLQAEDIHFGTLLAYNEPAGPYTGRMATMDSAQLRGLGPRSILTRDNYAILSGQEYRSRTYGHLNLFLLDELVFPGRSLDAGHWPPYGHVVRDIRAAGGMAFYAHGGYAQEIYADVVQGQVDGVELLQFGVYRGIGLKDWYRMLNVGFRLPASGACDYPACRKLGDCKTFVHLPERPSMRSWLQGMRAGASFVSSGPLLLLEVDGQRPGSQIAFKGAAPRRVTVRLRVRSEVAPVTDVQLIANGRVVRHLHVPADRRQGAWVEVEEPLMLRQSTWIAARAFSRSRLGTPDAESHTNPVYVHLNGRAPYDRASLDGLVQAIDKQIAVHKKRKFSEQAQVIAYFERSRDILMRIRAAGGVPAAGHPSDIARAEPTLDNPGRRTHTQRELKEFLKPQPAQPIDDVLRSFETQDGFQMQLVAREPLVNDPIAAAFDENGNLFVCEMRDYPYKPRAKQKPLGTVRLLRDTDGDGVFDVSHVFADQLLWPGGVAPWKGGVFVAAPPDIWYLRDTDGDHRADVRRKVYTGFGTDNQQAMVNNLKWGLDHRIYGSTAGNGGRIRHVDSGVDGDQQPISVNGRDFRFDPVGGRFEAISGTVQFGNTFDDWGNRFLCSESRPLQNAVLPQHYLERNPYLPVPSAIHNLTPRPVPIFRISPLERWRMIRSSRRIASGQRSPDSSGASHHVIDAAAGVTIYRGGAYPSGYYGNVFLGGAQSNLIHRRVLVPSGVTFDSKRADAKTEFVRSSDNWFRPVNFVNAPDGTLYVLDMSREILETIHVPLDVTKFLDFTSGRQHGRIYRLAPPDFRYPGKPGLGDADTAALVAALNSPHGWWRDTAHRLIYERQDPAAVQPLRRLLADGRRPVARLHALYGLLGLSQLTDSDLLIALESGHAGLQEHAMRLAEPRLDRAVELLKRVTRFAAADPVRLRFQAAFSLGASRTPQAADALARLARSAGEDRWLRTAVLSSSSGLADQMFVRLLTEVQFADSAHGAALLEQLASVVGARADRSQVDRVLLALAERFADDPSSNLLRRWLLSMGRGLQHSGQRLVSGPQTEASAVDFLAVVMRQARRTATDPQQPVAQRQIAIRLVGCADFGSAHALLEPLLDVRQPEPVQLTVVDTLSGYAQPEIAGSLLERWRAQSPSVRQRVVEALLARPERTKALLLAAQTGAASVSQVPMNRRSLLLKDRDPQTRDLARKLFGEQQQAASQRLIDDYARAAQRGGDAVRGERVFRQECMACHRVGKLGHRIGADLTSAPNRDPRALLTHVLDPNRYVLPRYETYLVVDTNGRTYTGMIASQSATSVVLKSRENKTETILRKNIEELSSTGKSLMPEGFEKKIDQQAMADLLTFLQSASQTSGPQRLHIGTLPGLVEPEKPRD